jgi:hypothetical protein
VRLRMCIPFVLLYLYSAIYCKSNFVFCPFYCLTFDLQNLITVFVSFLALLHYKQGSRLMYSMLYYIGELVKCRRRMIPEQTHIKTYN